MLTVAEALQLDLFRGAVTVAGQEGLNRPVAWVHVAGVPDAPRWLNGGELVLTTPINLPHTPEEQATYIAEMAALGVAGLVVAVGRYIDHTGETLRQAADAAHFPLVELPYEARFVDIARSLNQRIVQGNLAVTERALHISRVLTQLVLDGGDLKGLADTLAALVNQSISIENERFEILASANIAAVDEARRYTLSEGRTDLRLIAALEARGVLPEIRRTLRPAALPALPEVGLEFERILAPIVVHGEIYGWMWIIANDRPLTDLDRLAIESGATIAALLLLYQEAAQTAEATLKGGLLAQLIEGGSDPGRAAVLTDQALRYEVDLAAPYAVLVLEPGASDDAGDAAGSQGLVRLYRRVNRAVGQHGWRAVVAQFAGQIVLIASVSAEAVLERIVRELWRDAGGAESDATTGVRVGASALLRGADRVPAAYQQCRDALYIARRTGGGPVVLFGGLGYLHTLYQAGAGSLHSNRYAPLLRLLLHENGADLFRTLEAYVDSGGNGVATAQQLTIHRSTLNYRLARIAEICAVDLGDPLMRTNLQLAIKLMRLFDEHLGA